MQKIVDFRVGDKIFFNTKTLTISKIKGNLVELDDGSTINALVDKFKLVSNVLNEGDIVCFRKTNHKGEDSGLGDLVDQVAKVISSSSLKFNYQLDNGNTGSCYKSYAFRVKLVEHESVFLSMDGELKDGKITRGGVLVDGSIIPYFAIKLVDRSKILKNLRLKKLRKFSADKSELMRAFITLSKTKGLSDIPKQELRNKINEVGQEVYIVKSPKGRDLAEFKQRPTMKQIFAMFSDKKKRIQTKQDTAVNFLGLSLSKQNNIYTKPNQVLELQKYLSSKYPNKARRPKVPLLSKTNFVGIEIEQFSDWSRDKMEKQIIERGLDRYISTAEDGSIKPESYKNPLELRVMCSEKDLESVISRTCAMLSDAKSAVNTSCGMHVHIDMRNRDVNKSYVNLYKKLNEMESIIDKARVNNSYCKRPHGKTFQDQLSEGERYSAINTESYAKHKTLEVRYHEGSINKDRIVNWVRYLVSIVDRKSTRPLVQSLTKTA